MYVYICIYYSKTPEKGSPIDLIAMRKLDAQMYNIETWFSFLHLEKKMNSKWMKDINVKPKTVKLVLESRMEAKIIL